MSGRRNINKRRATIDNKCFNCGRMRHFGRDCTAPSTRKKNKTDESSSNNNSQQWQNDRPRRNQANIATTNTADDDESDTEPFWPGMANMAKDAYQQAPEGIWYLDSYASAIWPTIKTCLSVNFVLNALTSPLPVAKVCVPKVLGPSQFSWSTDLLSGEKEWRMLLSATPTW